MPPTLKVLLFLSCLLTLASVSPVETQESHLLEIEPKSHPRYRYLFRVNDPYHGNFQEKFEERDGEVVKGYYSLLQPNGIFRTVHYTADEYGFHPQITDQPSVGHIDNNVGIE